MSHWHIVFNFVYFSGQTTHILVINRKTVIMRKKFLIFTFIIIIQRQQLWKPNCVRIFPNFTVLKTWELFAGPSVGVLMKLGHCNSWRGFDKTWVSLQRQFWRSLDKNLVPWELTGCEQNLGIMKTNKGKQKEFKITSKLKL